MPVNLAGPRAVLARELMRDSCTLQPLGGSAVLSACGLVDPRRTPDAATRRGEAQLQARGAVVFRLPYTAPDLPLGSTIVYGDRLYAVVDPGLPVHTGTLARYVGCEDAGAYEAAPSPGGDEAGMGTGMEWPFTYEGGEW